LTADLAAAEQKKHAKKARRVQSATEIATEFGKTRPDAADILQTLAKRYENRAFLPQLRDVERFLERRGTRGSHLKSRRDAARPLMEALGKLANAELRELVVESEPGQESDYALLAREIMGAPKRSLYSEDHSRLEAVAIGSQFIFRTEDVLGPQHRGRKPPYEGKLLTVVGFTRGRKNQVVVRDPTGSESLMPLDRAEKALRSQ
jgi:hypothetical protein